MKSDRGIPTSISNQSKQISTGKTRKKLVFNWKTGNLEYHSEAEGHSPSAKPLFGFLRLESLIGALVVLGIAAFFLSFKYGWW
ncbi:MAG: hypothetical protein QM783_10420 [Phycisphaerales bacterium]